MVPYYFPLALKKYLSFVQENVFSESSLDSLASSYRDTQMFRLD